MDEQRVVATDPWTEGIEVAWCDHRQRVFDVAYRMLGSVSDAEDAVQESYLRLVRADLSTIGNVRGWLVTVTGRLCLDRLRSAAVRRAAYVGPWLPEPIVDLAGVEPNPADRVTLDESVRMALMIVLEQLSPAERTAFVLHDLFQVPFEAVGEIVGRSAAASRQLASRARRRIGSSTAEERFETTRDEQQRVAVEFARACQSGRMEDLVAVLDPSAVGLFDSGGLIPHAPIRPIKGAEHVARVALQSFAGTGAIFVVADVNGEPGVVVKIGGRLVAVISLSARDGRVVDLHGVGNPEKLRHLTASER